jgi:glycosyltransferase involved in cell wall biosynthesis
MPPRVVLVHERLTDIAGSENVVGHLARITNAQRIAVPIADPAMVPDSLAEIDITTTPLQRLYRGHGRYAHVLPLLPLAMGRIRLDDADLVISSHHAFANRIRPPAGMPFISYTHTPARWMWDSSKRDNEVGGASGRLLLDVFALTQRRPDRRAAARPDLIVANSTAVAGRIERWWGRESVVVPPPVETHWFTPSDRERGDFFLLAGRLVPYKTPEIAVRAAEIAGVPLVVAGDGRSLPALREMAGANVQFRGRVSDEELRDLYRSCRALVFPGDEDFGIVPVEAQACGTPVVAWATGGALDTVIDGVTGRLVGSPDDSGASVASALAEALDAFDSADYDRDRVRAHAETFRPERFAERMGDVISTVLPGWPN